MGILRSINKRYRRCLLKLKGGNMLTLSPKVHVGVPVRLSIKGPIVLEGQVSLGSPESPMIGDGAITLQTRNLAARIKIGEGTCLSNNVTIIACDAVTMGKMCMVGESVAVYDSDFHGVSPQERHTSGKSAPVVIGNNVWLGSRAMILKGVTIGDNSVVAAGAIVIRDVPPNTLVAGVPAKVIRTFDPQP